MDGVVGSQRESLGQLAGIAQNILAEIHLLDGLLPVPFKNSKVTGQVSGEDSSQLNHARQTDRNLRIAEPTHQEDGRTRASFGQRSDLRAALLLDEQLHQGGSVEVESEAGKGSTFTLFLPVAGRQEK